MKLYAVLLLILLLVASVLLLDAQNRDDGSSRLVGTWVVNVTQIQSASAAGRGSL